MVRVYYALGNRLILLLIGGDKEKQQALEAWERKLISITTGAKGNVVSIGSRKRPEQPA